MNNEKRHSPNLGQLELLYKPITSTKNLINKREQKGGVSGVETEWPGVHYFLENQSSEKGLKWE